MTAQTGRDPEPYGHNAACNWPTTRTLEPTKCDKCAWLVRHNLEPRS